MCQVYVSVLGGTLGSNEMAATYSIVATTPQTFDTAIWLEDGVPQLGQVDADGTAYYRARVDIAPTTLYALNLRSVLGSGTVNM